MIDVVIRGGLVIDGTGGPARQADVAVAGDRIAALGAVDASDAGIVLEGDGLVVAPGFVNMLSHSQFSILRDPRSLSDLLQGVTTQLVGEGNSMGPLTPPMRDDLQRSSENYGVEVGWTRLSEYLAHAERTGITQNLCSLVGATTVRRYVAGDDDRPLTPAELDVAGGLVREEMEEGALGIGSALVYPPAIFAPTSELVELSRVAASIGGIYMSHLRSEGNTLLEAIDEFLTIVREGEIAGEVWHFKSTGQANWHKMGPAIELLEAARADGLQVTADVYPYTRSATGLASSIPPRYHAGGLRRLFERLEDPAVRAEIRAAIEAPATDWSSPYQAAGGPEGVLVLGVARAENRRDQGLTLAEIARRDGAEPADALIDLLRRDRSRVVTAYSTISEDNLRQVLSLPWVSFGSDAPSMAAEGVFLESAMHPRAYGTFARVLGHYVRREGLLDLTEAVRRMTDHPASTLGLVKRGRVAEGWFADLVVLDAGTVSDHATFADPHQYSTGVRHVIVNGSVTVRDGQFTGEFAGRALRRGSFR